MGHIEGSSVPEVGIKKPSALIKASIQIKPLAVLTTIRGTDGNEYLVTFPFPTTVGSAEGILLPHLRKTIEDTNGEIKNESIPITDKCLREIRGYIFETYVREYLKTYGDSHWGSSHPQTIEKYK